MRLHNKNCADYAVTFILSSGIALKTPTLNESEKF